MNEIEETKQTSKSGEQETKNSIENQNNVENKKSLGDETNEKLKGVLDLERQQYGSSTVEAIKLDSGKFLVNRYGKYQPNLTFIQMLPNEIVYKHIENKELNLNEGCLSYVKGRFFVSKKGTNCFEIKSDGEHILICDSWGGAFNDYRGGNLKKLPNQVYYRCALSNGGGIGCDYVVVPVGTKFLLSEDDI